MRLIKFLSVLFAATVVFSACEKSNEPQEVILVPPLGNEDCWPEIRGFLEMVSLLGNQSDNFIIRGIVKGEPVENAGREIQIINDYKGNYAGEPSIILWGGYVGEHWNEDGDDVSKYVKGDTLIFFAYKGYWWTDEEITEREYYAVSLCDCRVLKFSDGNVIGGINSGIAGKGDNEPETMPYAQFLEQINQILINNEN